MISTLVAPSSQTMYSGAGHHMEALDMAAKLIDSHLQMDSSYPQLVDLLQVSGGYPSVSGLSDHDYPALKELSSSLQLLSQLSLVNKAPLPAELVEQFGHMQSNCQMGLFPQIGRAWLTIDSDIFVWMYEDGDDLAYFDGLSETILGVGLVKPKPGIFQNHIQFLLCLTTPVEIVLLGVSFSRRHETSSPFDEMHLLPEPLYTLPTDNTLIQTIAGADNGRIFLGGKDGCLHELVYQAEDGWFRRKCKKVNHSSSSLSFLVPSFLNFAFSEEDPIVQIEIDDSRHILYTRSDKGTIQVFDLGADGKQLTKVIAVSQNSIVQQAVNIAKTIDRSNFRPVVHISALDIVESVHINLVAVTQSGVRFYFTTTSLIHPEARPFTLLLLHVRLPPGFSANAPLQRPSHVHMAHYRKGCALLASSQTEDSDVIWTMSNDSFPFQSQLMELHTVIPVDGKTWCMTEVLQLQPPKPLCTLNINNVILPSEPPLVVSQHAELPRKFVVLSAQGSQIVTKLRPIDQLRHLLLANNGPDCEPVKAFFILHKQTQACAMCLILACSRMTQEEQVAEWATRAFLLYGGEPCISFPVPSNPSSLMVSPSSPAPTFGPSTVPAWSSTPAVGHHPGTTFSVPGSGIPYSPVVSLNQTYGLPSQEQQSVLTQQQLPSGGPEMIYSGKHNGLYLYLSRILRPIWNLKVVSDIPYKSKKGDLDYLASSVSSEDLSRYLEQLHALKDFVQNNSQFSLATGANGVSLGQNVSQVLNFLRPETLTPGEMTQMQQQLSRKSQAEAQLQERSSLLNLQQLLNYTCEVLGLWKVLCDHQFHIITGMLSKDFQNQMKVITCRDFVCNGREVAGALVTALINRYLDDNATTDAISGRLREVCPTIFKVEDAVFSKAHEMLVNARNIQSKQEKEKLLREALQLCMQVSSQLNLQSVCTLFQQAHYYRGILDLSLSAAQRRDPQGLALHFYKNGEPPEDQQGLQYYSSRMECYRTVMENLNHLLTLSTSLPQSPSIPRVPGPPPTRDPNLLSQEEARVYFEQMFQLALKSDDELFHVALYDWLTEQHQTERLLDIKSPFLENYLKQCTTAQSDNLSSVELMWKSDNLSSVELMWKFYEKNQNYSAAARILAKLSDRHGNDINLHQRLEYLSRAIICVKSSELRITTAGEGEFLHDLEEKMEVARIQLQVLEALTKKSVQVPAIQDAISRLNSDLLDITQLYEDFAEVYDLPECKLAIVHCAGHYDPTLIESLWQNIIDKELSCMARASPATRMASLSIKVKSLGKLYISAQKYFPLTFLVKYLELKTCNEDFTQNWLFSTLLEVGVDLPQLHETYYKLYRSKDLCWKTARKPFHLLKVIVSLIAAFVERPSLVHLNERRAFTTKCLDAVAGYLVDLQSCNSADPSVQALSSDFKAVQLKLERLP